MPEFVTYFPSTYLPSEGFKIEGHNIDCVHDENWHSAMLLNLTQDSFGTNPGFTSSTGLVVSLTTEAYGGHNSYGGVAETFTQGKHTFNPFAVDAVHRAAGQRILTFLSQTTYGMGDAAVIGLRHTYFGGPIAGDEGQGFGLVSHLDQGHRYPDRRGDRRRDGAGHPIGA